MPDEDLRNLIGEMSGCRYTNDKIKMVERHVRNLNDFAEVLNACFAGEEYARAFALLGDAELFVIFHRLRERKGDVLFDRSRNAEWENAFLDYLNALAPPEREGFPRP